MQQPTDQQPLRGVIVPILTPLTPDEAVDVASLRRLVNYLVDNGVHGIWAAGTTGEFAALDEEARRLVIETVADEAAGRVPVIGNISARPRAPPPTPRPRCETARWTASRRRRPTITATPRPSWATTSARSPSAVTTRCGSITSRLP